MKLLPKFDAYNYRSIRGSYVLNPSSALRPALHARIVPDKQDYDIGFRMCREVR